MSKSGDLNFKIPIYFNKEQQTDIFIVRTHAEAAESDKIFARILNWIHIDTFVKNSEFIHGHSVQNWRPKIQNSNFTSMRND